MIEYPKYSVTWADSVPSNLVLSIYLVLIYMHRFLLGHIYHNDTTNIYTLHKHSDITLRKPNLPRFGCAPRKPSTFRSSPSLPSWRDMPLWPVGTARDRCASNPLSSNKFVKVSPTSGNLCLIDGVSTFSFLHILNISSTSYSLLRAARSSGFSHVSEIQNFKSVMNVCWNIRYYKVLFAILSSELVVVVVGVEYECKWVLNFVFF